MAVKVLGDQIGQNVLTYVDDIIVLNSKRENHIADLSETFANFRRAGLKLNPAKSIFGVERGKISRMLCIHQAHRSKPIEN